MQVCDANMVIDTARATDTWCVYEHHVTFQAGQPPEVILVGAERLIDVYRLITGKTNSEWAAIFTNGGSVLVRIIASGTDREEIVRHAASHARSFNPMPRCNLRGFNMRGASRPIKDATTGKLYGSQKEAAEDLGIQQSAISRHLAGRLSHVGGHVFQYEGVAKL